MSMDHIGAIHGEKYCYSCNDYNQTTTYGICNGCRTVKYFKGYTPPNYLNVRGDKDEQGRRVAKELPKLQTCGKRV